MRPYLALLAPALACTPAAQAPHDDTGGASTACEDSTCAFDQFCHQDMCTPVDDRSFRLAFEDGLQTGEASPDRWYAVKVTYDGASCWTDGEQNPVARWDEACDVVVDLDTPFLEIALYEGYFDDDYDEEACWEFTGVDAVVGMIRSGGGILEVGDNDQTRLPYTVTPNF
ncbi:MAG: hypothetical protein ABIO70_09450 [Pseudomonadota bacterium]